MKTFDQLDSAEQEAAVRAATNSLLTAIVEGAIRFSDEKNGDDLQARIDAAQAKAEEMRTPWFAHEYVMDTCREEVEGMARADAEEALYSEPGERVIAGIVGRAGELARTGKAA
jgi:hypothetical protein